MPCRAGITTDLKERKQYWESQVVGLNNWTEYGPYNSKKEAQAQEDKLRQEYGCEGHPGGPDVNKPWSAYKFDYIKEK